MPGIKSLDKSKVNGQTFLNQYGLIKEIAKSDFSSIWLAEADSRQFALKIYKKFQLKKEKQYHKRPDEKGMTVTDQLMKVMQHEVATLQYLADKSVDTICGLLDMMECDEKLILVFDLCEGGQIMTWYPSSLEFKPATGEEWLPESLIKDWMRDLCRGLERLHTVGVVHRDIKPQNILLRHGKPVIADFGVSSVIPSNGVDSFSQTEGTIHCLAPEVCDPDVDSYAAKPVDVWALGVALFCMVYNKLPFEGNTPYLIMENIH